MPLTEVRLMRPDDPFMTGGPIVFTFGRPLALDADEGERTLEGEGQSDGPDSEARKESAEE